MLTLIECNPIISFINTVNLTTIINPIISLLTLISTIKTLTNLPITIQFAILFVSMRRYFIFAENEIVKIIGIVFSWIFNFSVSLVCLIFLKFY